MITTKVSLQLVDQTVPAIIPVVQGDTGRSIIFEPSDFTIPEGATATYYIQKPSGEAVYNSAEITGNTVVCNLTAQSIIETGENNMQIRIILGEDIVTSFDAILMVRPFRGIGAVESKTEINIFDKAVEEAEQEISDKADEIIAEKVPELEAIVEEVIESIPADYTALTNKVAAMLADMATEFSAEATYQPGDIVIYGNDLYRKKNGPNITGEWIAAQWEAITLGSAIEQIVGNLAPQYDQTATYHKDDAVIYLGDLYICTSTLSVTGTWDASKWSKTDVSSLAPAVDATLTQQGKPADAKKVGDELTNIKADLKDIAPKFDDYPIYKGYIESKVWKSIGSGTNQYTVVPCKSGDKLTIIAPSTGNATIAAMKSYSTPTTGDSVDFSSVTGWTNTVSITSNTEQSFTIPSDAHYLFVFLGSGASYPRKPTAFILNGYDYLDAFSNQFSHVVAEIDEIEEVAVVAEDVRTFDSYGEIHGYINGTAWSVGSNYSAIIPVKGGEKIEIIAPTSSGDTAWYAALKTHTEPETGTTADFSSAEGWDSTRSIAAGNGFIGNLPSDAKYLYVYLGGGGRPRKPLRLTLDGYDLIGTFVSNISDKVRSESAVPTVRFMQWNIGAFDYGRKESSGNPQGMSEEQYQEKLPKYRQFFCDYKPDIVCLQEYLPYMDKLHTHSTDEVLFGPILPNTARSGPLVIKTIYPIMMYELGNLPSTQGYACPYIMAVLDIYGKKVAVFTTALYYARTGDAYSARTQEFTKLLELGSQYDYAIVCADVNCSGKSDVTSQTEAQERIAYAESVGWEGCNGGYLGWSMTHRDTEYGERPLDNILYKNNGNMVFRNFDVLNEEYDNVSSDHYALIADFAIN